MSELSISGTIVRVERVSPTKYTFGEFGTFQNLEEINASGGFINAMMDVMNGEYPILESGFNSHLSWEALADGIKKDDAAYVNWDMLTNPFIIEKLAGFGLTKRPDRQGWLILNAKDGRLYGDHYANPKTEMEIFLGLNLLPADYPQLSKEDKKAARKAAHAQLHPDVFNNNQHEWNIVMKQNGLKLVRLLIAEKVRVVANLITSDGFEWKVASAERKIITLFGTVMDRVTLRQNINNRLRERQAVERGGYYVKRYSEMEARVDEAVSAGLVEITPAELVGHRFFLVQNGNRVHDRFARNLDQAKGQVDFAMTWKFDIELAES